MVKNCYIHIPFCDKICSYCDFSKILSKKEWIDKYLDCLEEEIKRIYQEEELETIYIGGGTPSSLSLKQLERLFKLLERLKMKEKYEYTIEGNFESTTIDKLKLYKKYGINRLSFGLESINPKNLAFLNRTADCKKIETILKETKNLGFHNRNIDLMYALPTEDKRIVKKDLDYILSLDVEHISTYSLMIEKNTKLSINHIQPIEEEKDYEMYKMICNTLKRNGYIHYEISNFSKKGYESKHNLVYWRNEEYYGFGLGASSYIQNKRKKNTSSLTKYLKKEFAQEEETLTEKDKIEYEVILNLRKKEGILLSTFQKKYHKDIRDYYEYTSLVKEKLLVKQRNKLFIPENKWYISNEIIVRLLEKEVNK